MRLSLFLFFFFPIQSSPVQLSTTHLFVYFFTHIFGMCSLLNVMKDPFNELQLNVICISIRFIWSSKQKICRLIRSLLCTFSFEEKIQCIDKIKFSLKVIYGSKHWFSPATLLSLFFSSKITLWCSKMLIHLWQVLEHNWLTDGVVIRTFSMYFSN